MIRYAAASVALFAALSGGAQAQGPTPPGNAPGAQAAQGSAAKVLPPSTVPPSAAVTLAATSAVRLIDRLRMLFVLLPGLARRLAAPSYRSGGKESCVGRYLNK